ncbi:unnamed protein product [Staurois parvus]|uniref:C2H2-type domain-containing protein n=1 Tax=Staurois parvus TaxID=386267 RepID=A0ABN9EQ81_9NEOB|nr:unnamed protein product [Staurois parvus]
MILQWRENISHTQKKVHNGGKPYHCSECEKTFTSKSEKPYSTPTLESSHWRSHISVLNVIKLLLRNHILSRSPEYSHWRESHISVFTECDKTFTQKVTSYLNVTPQEDSHWREVISVF